MNVGVVVGDNKANNFEWQTTQKNKWNYLRSKQKSIRIKSRAYSRDKKRQLN